MASSSRSDIRWAVALYSYKGSESNRTLSINAGQVLKVDPREGKDWWPADLDGVHGFVPRTYIKLFEPGWDPKQEGGETAIKDAVQSAEKSARTSVSAPGSGELNDVSNAETVKKAGKKLLKRHGSGAHRKERHHHKLVPAIALYTFKKQEKGQLAFTKGDKLQVHPKKTSDWWPAVSASGKGLVPKNYIRLVDESAENNESPTAAAASGAEGSEASDSKAQPASRKSRKTKGSPKPGAERGTASEKPKPHSRRHRRTSKGKAVPEAARRSSEKPGSGNQSDEQQGRMLVVAQYDFSGSTSRELGFHQGDFLEVEPREGVDWWPARSASGETGLVPSNYVKVLGPASGNLLSAAGQTNRLSKDQGATANGSSGLQKTERFSPGNTGTTRRWQTLSGNVGMKEASFMHGWSGLDQLPFFRVLLNDMENDPNTKRDALRVFEQHMYFRTFRDGQIIVSEGLFNYNMYIILHGNLSVLHGTIDLCTLRSKEWFGESSMIKHQPYPVTVTSSGPSTVLALSTESYKLLAKQLPSVVKPLRELVYAHSVEFLRTVPFFAVFSDENLEILGAMLTFEKVVARQRIYKQGETTKSFRIVLAGKVALTVASDIAGNNNMLIKHVGPGGCFGEAALDKPSNRAETATATTDAMVVTISGSKFARFLALDERVEHQFLSVLKFRSGKSLSTIPMLHAVSDQKLDPLAAMMDFRLFKVGDTVYKHGSNGSTFYMVASGEMEATTADGKQLRTFKVGGYFGESALVEECVRDETVRCTDGPCICIVLQLEAFRTFLTANPEVRALLLDSVINRGLDARIRRRAANTQPSELAGVHDLPATMFETAECTKALKVWRSIGMAMAPCLRILQGWPQYMHPPEFQLSSKRKRKFMVTVVGISEEIRTTKIHTSIHNTVMDVVNQTFKNYQQRMNGEMIDPDGPEVFALKVAGRSDYLLHQGMELGFYKYVTRCLRRGMDKGEIELALVDLRCDPKTSTGLRNAISRIGAKTQQRTATEGPVDGEYEYGVRHYAVALYDYDHSELNFRKGDKLQVEPQPDEWWPAIFKGKAGLIPMHYVNVLGAVGERNDEPLRNRFSLTRQLSDSKIPSSRLPGMPTMTPSDWAEIVRKGTAKAVEIPDSFDANVKPTENAMSAHDLMWPFRIQLRGIQKLRSLHRLLKFDLISIRVDLVCGGQILESKTTQPFKRKSVIRLDDEWYYFNRLVGHLHASTRVCFTVIGMDKKSTKPTKTTTLTETIGSGGGFGQSSIMYGTTLTGNAVQVDAERVLGGGAFQIYSEEYVLKTGTQMLHLWPDAVGEQSFYCENNPAPNAPELVVQLDEYAAPVYYPVGEEVHVKRHSSSARRGSELSTSFRDMRREPTGNANVDAILRLDPIRTYRMSETEKRFLWQERGKLVKRPDALPKFLFAVDWANPDQRLQALTLLKEWTPPGPMQAMELLDCRHIDIRVRQYAVQCLEAFDDDELCEFLLQLVQVLKYEPFHESSLARFLLRRALQNPREIGMRLFWALRAEMHKLRFATRFGLLLQVYLQSCGRHREELTQQYDVQELLKGVAAKMVTQKFSNKQERSAYCRLELEQLNQKLPRSFYLSIDPRIAVKKLVTERCKVMNSKKKPLWLVMENVDPVELGGSNVSVMFKAGDDLRQDQMTLQLLRVMEQMWLEEGLDLRLTPYQCISTGDELGMLELVTKADTTANIQIKYGGRMGALSEKTIRLWLEEHNKANFAVAMDHFVHSCAGYAVATFVMGIGDRHSDNIMVKESGHLFHIDFGHFLGNFKSKYGVKRERTAFVFTKEMAYVMGGKGEKPFQAFVELCCKAFNILRRHGNDLINLFRLMIPAGMPELESDVDIDYLCTMLHLDKSDEEAAEIFKREIFTSLNDTYRRLDNLLHNWKQG